MGRESLLNKVELLCKKIGSNCNNKHDSNKQESLSSEPANGDEIYDDVASGGKRNGHILLFHDDIPWFIEYL